MEPRPQPVEVCRKRVVWVGVPYRFPWSASMINHVPNTRVDPICGGHEAQALGSLLDNPVSTVLKRFFLEPHLVLRSIDEQHSNFPRSLWQCFLKCGLCTTGELVRNVNSQVPLQSY